MSFINMKLTQTEIGANYSNIFTVITMILDFKIAVLAINQL